MKRPTFFLSVAILILIACQKEAQNTCDTRSYYNKSEKHLQSEIYTKATVSFYDTLSYDMTADILNDFPVCFDNRENTYPGNYIIIDIDSESCNDTEELFNSLKQHEMISNCNMWLITDEGNERGMYDMFLCKLKHDSLENRLPDIIRITRTEYVRKNYDVHVVRADKFSEGDALDMANDFYETGYFDWCEPDYLGQFSPHN